MSSSRTPSPFAPHLWHSPQSASSLVKNLAENFFYTIFAHIGLVWPDTLPNRVLETFSANGTYPEPSAIPDNNLIRCTIKPAVQFLLPVLQELYAEKERQDAALVNIDPAGGPAEQKDFCLHLAGQIRSAHTTFSLKLQLNDTKAQSIQMALRRHSFSIADMIERLWLIMERANSFIIPDEGEEDEQSTGEEYKSPYDSVNFNTVAAHSTPNDKHTALGSPLLLTTPVNNTPESPIDQGSSNEEISGDDSMLMSNQFSLDSSGFLGVRGVGCSPSTAPTTPARSPANDPEKPAKTEKTKTRNRQQRLFAPPPDSDVPTLVLTAPTSKASTNSRDSLKGNSAVETSSPRIPLSAASSTRISSSNESQVEHQMYQSGDSVSEHTQRRPAARDSYQTPPRNSASLPSNQIRRPVPRKPVPLLHLEEQAGTEPSQRSSSPAPSVLQSIPGSQDETRPRTEPHFPDYRSRPLPEIPSSSTLREATNRLPKPVGGREAKLSIRIPPTPLRTRPQTEDPAAGPSRKDDTSNSRGIPPKSRRHSTSDSTGRSTGAPSVDSRRSSVSQHTISSYQETVLSYRHYCEEPKVKPKSKKVKQVWKGKNTEWSPIQQEGRAASGARYYQSLHATTCCCHIRGCPCRTSAPRASHRISPNEAGLYRVSSADMESNNNGFMKSAGLAFEVPTPFTFEI